MCCSHLSRIIRITDEVIDYRVWLYALHKELYPAEHRQRTIEEAIFDRSRAPTVITTMRPPPPHHFSLPFANAPPPVLALMFTSIRTVTQRLA